MFEYNTVGALYGNNLKSLYQLSSVYIGQNWYFDQWSLIGHQLLLGHGLQVGKLK